MPLPPVEESAHAPAFPGPPTHCTHPCTHPLQRPQLAGAGDRGCSRQRPAAGAATVRRTCLQLAHQVDERVAALAQLTDHPQAAPPKLILLACHCAPAHVTGAQAQALPKALPAARPRWERFWGSRQLCEAVHADGCRRWQQAGRRRQRRRLTPGGSATPASSRAASWPRCASTPSGFAATSPYRAVSKKTCRRRACSISLLQIPHRMMRPDRPISGEASARLLRVCWQSGSRLLAGEAALDLELSAASHHAALPDLTSISPASVPAAAFAISRKKVSKWTSPSCCQLHKRRIYRVTPISYYGGCRSLAMACAGRP